MTHRTLLFFCLSLISLPGFAGEKPAFNSPANSPLLICQVTYAGTTHIVKAGPVADPYPVPSVDIGGRFWFKAVMVGNSRHVDRVLIYTYFDTAPHPVLIHQAKYLPPFITSQGQGGPLPLTGQHHLYAGTVERELIYSCTLEGLAP